MKVLWEERAWADYLYWQMQDRKTLKRINELVKDMQRDAFHGKFHSAAVADGTNRDENKGATRRCLV